MRRVVYWLLLSSAACLALLVMGIGLTGYLATRPPAFYSRLLATAPNPAAAQAAEQRLEQMRSDFLLWRTHSVAAHQAANVQAANAQPPAGQAPTATHTLRVTADEINTLLANQPPRLAGGALSAPRVYFGDGRVALALTVASPAGALPLTAWFEPLPPTAGELRARLTNVNLGQLPLPIATLTKLLPKNQDRLSGELYLDTTGDLPELALRTKGNATQAADPKSITFAEGEVVVTLAMPE